MSGPAAQLGAQVPRGRARGRFARPARLEGRAGRERGDRGARARRRPAAPAFTLPRLDGDGELSLASLRGKAVVVNFWASWCVPCKEEAPLLEQASERSPRRARRRRDRRPGLQGRRARVHRADGITYPIVHDGKGSTIGRYGVTGFPETFFVDRGGKVVAADRRAGRDARGEARRQDRAGARTVVSASRRRSLALRARRPGGGERRRPTAADLEAELVCPICETTLDQSERAGRAADEGVHPRRIAAGDTKSEIKAKLVAQFGRGVLAGRRSAASTCSPGCCRSPARVSAPVAVGGSPGVEPRRADGAEAGAEAAARPRARAAGRRGARPLRGVGRGLSELPVALVAGFLSFLAPCVLPLVPGYLSAVSAVEAERLGERGTAGGSSSQACRSCSASQPSSSCSGRQRRSSATRSPATSSCSSASPGSSSSSSGSPSWASCRGRSACSAPGSFRGAPPGLSGPAGRCVRDLRGAVHRPRAGGHPRAGRALGHSPPGRGTAGRLLARARDPVRARRRALHPRDGRCSDGSATTTGRSSSRAAPSWSRSACCSSSASSTGCGST